MNSDAFISAISSKLMNTGIKESTIQNFALQLENHLYSNSENNYTKYQLDIKFALSEMEVCMIQKMQVEDLANKVLSLEKSQDEDNNESQNVEIMKNEVLKELKEFKELKEEEIDSCIISP